MVDMLSVDEKFGEYIKTYYIQSKFDKVEDFTKVLEEKLPTLIEGHKFELLKDSFEQDRFQYLGERANNFNRRGRGNFGSGSASRGRTPRIYTWVWRPIRDGSRNNYPAITDFVNQQAALIERDRNNFLKTMAHFLSTMSVTELEASGYAMAGFRAAQHWLRWY
ncbi:hypothetical protein GGI17_006247 [Coemansia sp. S146]|nr:hypothetical protein GGI17_006247 [Coemansia sp. S146]